MRLPAVSTISLAFLVIANCAVAQQARDHCRSVKIDTTPCEIVEWKATWNNVVGMLMIEGVTSCMEGMAIIQIREHDGSENGEFLARERAYIAGESFSIMTIMESKPDMDGLYLRYAME